MSTVEGTPQSTKPLASVAKPQAASTPATTTPSKPTNAGSTLSIQNGPKSDTFTVSNNLFLGTLDTEAKEGRRIVSPMGSTPAGSTPAGSTPAGSTLAGSTLAGSTTPESAIRLPLGSTMLGSTTPGTSPLEITKDTQGGTDQVSKALEQIANDPDGKKLIEAAKAKGYTVEISNDPGEEGAAAWTDPRSKKIVIDMDEKGLDSYNLTATIAHELVHAATDNDGDSFIEEALSTSVGNRIAKRIDGKTLTPEEETADFKKIYDDYKKAYEDDGAVGGLEDNGIVDHLQGIGIDLTPQLQVINGGGNDDTEIRRALKRISEGFSLNSS